LVIWLGDSPKDNNTSQPSTDATSASAAGSQSSGSQSSSSQSSGSESSSSSDDSSDNGDNGDHGDTVVCGGTGPSGYPSPDDPGGNDGGAIIPHHIPSGAGLASVFTLTSAGYFQFGAFPQLDVKGKVVSGGFVSV
jgi:hypothetical protein